MDTTALLDVLIVYSSGLALSASVPNSVSRHPFPLRSPSSIYNKAYAYFLRECKKSGLNAGFAASEDIIGPATTQCYWTVVSGNWIKVHASARALQVFDKLSSPSTERAAERKLLLSDSPDIAFNDNEIISVFTDKLQTFQKFSHATLPTVAVPSRNRKDIETALAELEELRKLPQHRESFSQQVILKDRFGCAGNEVHKIDQPTVAKIQSIMRKSPDTTYILQPFLLFDTGYSYRGNTTPTDIRLVFHNNELLQCYLRTAEKGDFRCNAHQGGEVAYITDSEIPGAVITAAQNVLKTLNKPQALISLDFALSNAGIVYLIEGNSGPGLYWDESMKLDEKKVKQLIRSVVKELVVRTKMRKSALLM